jgi:glycosyltransferase involved in cell wall biosynthesis
MLDSLPGGTKVQLRPIDARDAGRRFLGKRGRLPLTLSVNESDHIHLHGVWERLLSTAAAVARSHAIPYAVSPHGMLDPWSLSQSAAKKRVAMALYARRMLNGAAFIHALNADESRLIAPLSLKAPVRTVPNGVFLEELAPTPAPGAFREQHKDLGPDPYILFLARLHPKKGLDLLASAFAHVLAAVPRAKLVIAGPDEGALPSFRALADELGISSRILIVGPLYGARKLEALCGAACFCLPSRQEGFSVAILEAMASGVPVVVSDQCHFPEVREQCAGRVVPLDPGAIASALIEVLSAPSLADQLGAAGARLVREQYSWPRIAGEFLAAYHESRPMNPGLERPPCASFTP